MMKFLTMVVCLLALAGSAAAEEMKYKPVNPSFGGDPFNGSYLLSSATAQRSYEQKTKKRDPMEEFADDVKSTIMRDVAARISDSMLGENAKSSGSFTVGTMGVDFRRNGDTVQVEIRDRSSGGTTQLEIPVPTM